MAAVTSSDPVYFSHPGELRAWMEKNHKNAAELLVGYYKKGSKIPSITWPESVEQALCFGWIDGVRRSIDEHRYCIRFTPRRPGSIWSRINIAMVEKLKKQGLMHPMGLEAYAKMDTKKAGLYSFEQEKHPELTAAYIKKFKVNKAAWKWFEAAPAYYRKTAAHWVMSAKQEDTRLRRLETLIADSEAGIKIKPLRYGKN